MTGADSWILDELNGLNDTCMNGLLSDVNLVLYPAEEDDFRPKEVYEKFQTKKVRQKHLE